MEKFQLEICANSINSAIAASKAGAHRIELCDNIREGGTTASYASIKWCVENLKLEVWPLIRPRGGDFLYNEVEFECLLEDIRICKNLGCQGVVTGVLLAKGDIDIERCQKILEVASPISVAFHRAFDACNNPEKTIEQLIDLGFVRILTSGTYPSAFEGKNEIAKYIQLAKGRIEIMPGAGINSENIIEIAKATSALCFHSTAKTIIKSNMNQKSKYINEIQGDELLESDEIQIKTLLSQLEKYFSS